MWHRLFFACLCLLFASPAPLTAGSPGPFGADVPRALATRRPDVRAPRELSPTAEPGAIGENLSLIGAPAAWARGVTGQGVVVAVLDSGVDLNHPDLKARWRGSANSWFDPYGESPDVPIDLNGHGTQVLGVILGGDASGAPIGIAPDAQWIAAKVFDVRGRATAEAIHRALQWVLDPDGDPATDDAPDVVNSSWAAVIGLCKAEFSEDLRALRAAGILPIFAAGVDGQTGPANTPKAFAVGALAGPTAVSPDSPRGPSVCPGKTVFPDIVAPSGNVRTSDLFGTYTTLDGGTSIAAAHVSGALALLLSADPSLTVEQQEALLTESAVDLGEPGPDHIYGYGRLNVAAALDRVLGSVAVLAVAAPVGTPDSSRDDRAHATDAIWALIVALVVLVIRLVIVSRHLPHSTRAA